MFIANVITDFTDKYTELWLAVTISGIKMCILGLAKQHPEKGTTLAILYLTGIIY